MHELRQWLMRAGAEAALPVPQGLLRELPKLLLMCVVEMQTEQVLASYTTHASLNLLLRTLPAAQGASPLLDHTLVSDDQCHHVRPRRAVVLMTANKTAIGIHTQLPTLLAAFGNRG